MSSLLSKLVPWLQIIPFIAMGSVCGIVAYVIFALVTSSLLMILPISAAAFFATCYRLTYLTAESNGLKRPIRFALAVSSAAAILIALMIAWPTLDELLTPYPDNATPAVIRALQTSAVPLQTVHAGSGFEDFQPLKSILNDKRIVALGEATHGTSEFFSMKHRLLEFLVHEMGFTHFGMELSPRDGQVINEYIQGGSQDFRHVLYWPWATVEVMTMIDWMRTYNADPNSPMKVVFHGIDPGMGERDAVMANNVAQLLTQSGPDSKIVLWAHNAHISNASGWMGHYLKQEFGNQVYLLGFEFDRGRFTSRMVTVQTYSVGPTSPAYYAYAIARLKEPILLLDFQTMERVAELQTWLVKAQNSHEFQELHAIYRLNPDWYTLRTSWLQLYDGVIFIEESTPAVGLSK